MRITRQMLDLQIIIDQNEEAAELGHLQARGQIVEAQAELDRLILAALQPQRDDQLEAEMLDLAGCSDPYAPPRPSAY